MIAIVKFIPGITKLIPRLSIASDPDLNSLIMVMIFSGLGLVVSLGLLLLDQHLNGGWF